MKTALKLYCSPGSASLSVHIALRELAQKRLARGSDHLTVSPLGYVPLLELSDGSRHTETAALLQWIAELDREQRPAAIAASCAEGMEP